MINQQLVDFIKQQLQVGLTKEKISSQLLVNGWTIQDIEEGFSAVVPPIITPPVSPYSGASYPQNTNPIKTAEIQQQTFEPQVQQSPIQNIPLETQPSFFEKNVKLIGWGGIILEILFGIFWGHVGGLKISFLSDAVSEKVLYLLFLNGTLFIQFWVLVLFAKIFKGQKRSLIKALSFIGLGGFLSIPSAILFSLSSSFSFNIILLILFLMITIAFLSKIYLISPLRAFSLWLVSSISTGIIILIIMFAVGFSFLFSIFNALQNQNLISDTNTIQQVVPTQDQTQQTGQNIESHAIPTQIPQNNTNDSSNYTNPTYGYSFKYPIGWKLNDTYPNSIRIALDDSFPPEDLEIYASVGIHTEASAEDSLKYGNTPYQKEKITIAGVSATKLTFDSNDKIGSSTAYGRNVILYIPNKNKIGEEIVINGNCSTWTTNNHDKKCSTAIDDIMNNLVFPSISFKK